LLSFQPPQSESPARLLAADCRMFGRLRLADTQRTEAARGQTQLMPATSGARQKRAATCSSVLAEAALRPRLRLLRARGAQRLRLPLRYRWAGVGRCSGLGQADSTIEEPLDNATRTISEGAETESAARKPRWDYLCTELRPCCWARLALLPLPGHNDELLLKRPSQSLHIDVFGPTDQTSLL
jgi:hypothetical protein